MSRGMRLLLSVFAAVWIAGCAQSEPSREPDPTIALGPGESYVYSVDEGPFASYRAGKVIDGTCVGSKIGDVTLTAGWKRNGDETWLSREDLRTEVFAIESVGDDVAVALKFLDKGDALTTTHYYVIWNPRADLTAVADYVIEPYAPNHPGDE